MGNEQKKPKMEFTIIKNDPLDGDKGFGVGSLSLENVTPVIIDVEAQEAWIDMAAMHAKTKLERSLKFLPTREESKNGKQYWINWVTVEYKEDRKSTRLNSSHVSISYAVFCLKKKNELSARG